MVIRVRSSRRRGRNKILVQKPRGQFTHRVQAVGPEHFGIVTVDCAKARSKFMLADFFGNVHVPPTLVAHTQGDLQAAIERIRRALLDHDLRDFVVAIERTGEYHRPVQRAFRQLGWDVRLVHSFATHQYRQPADPGNKTDDTDLAALQRATVNGFGLADTPWPDDYQQWQLLMRHRRDLMHKLTALRCQIREHLHAAMPGYAELFEDPWTTPVALPLARHFGSAPAIRQAGLQGLQQFLTEAQLRCQQRTLVQILAWAETAAPGHPHADFLRSIISTLDEDRLVKTQQILALERSAAGFLTRTPYVLLLIIPGINVVSAADLGGEMGPPPLYANANAITGRAGLMPTRYQSDRVDHASGPLRRCANRRLRTALMQIADNLVKCNHYFGARSTLWRQSDKDPRWIRVKVAKIFSRIAFAMVVGRRLFHHPCCQQRHYVLDKLLAFHREHATPMDQVLRDLQAALEQLPRSAYAEEAQPLAERLRTLQATRRGPQLLANILPLVLARLGVPQVQSPVSEARDLS
jgi:transposase